MGRMARLRSAQDESAEQALGTLNPRRPTDPEHGVPAPRRCPGAEELSLDRPSGRFFLLPFSTCHVTKMASLTTAATPGLSRSWQNAHFSGIDTGGTAREHLDFH